MSESRESPSDCPAVHSRTRFWVLIVVLPIVLLALYVLSFGPMYALAVLTSRPGSEWPLWLSARVYAPMYMLANEYDWVRDTLLAYSDWCTDLMLGP